VRVSEIRIFPVKGLRGEVLAAAEVTPAGLAGDRRWMVVDARGRFLSQRELPRMALVQARLVGGGVVLSAGGVAVLAVRVPGGDAARRDVAIWRDTVPAADAGDTAAAWLGGVLGVACRLVYLADDGARGVNREFGAPGDVVSFADGYPLLLASSASLAALNARLAVPVAMLRFRPNLVIEGAAAWAEYEWARVRIGQAVFRVVKPCDRCVVTTIDPETGLRPDTEEPLRTLKTFRRDARGRVLFGQNLVPDGGGVVRVGDTVEVLAGVGAPAGAVVPGRAG
jgi:uncharacterized protein YcbX